MTNLTTYSEALELERKVKTREITRFDVEIKVTEADAKSLIFRPAVQDTPQGWSFWTIMDEKDGVCDMEIRWTHNEGYYAQYNRPQYDGLELGDMEEYELDCLREEEGDE